MAIESGDKRVAGRLHSASGHALRLAYHEAAQAGSTPAAGTAAAVVRATFDSAPDGIVVLDRDGQLLTWNPAFERLWNFPPELLAHRDVRSMRLHTAVQLSDPQAYLDSIDGLFATRQSRVFDVVPLRDGRVFKRHVSPLGPVAGVPQAAGGIVVRWRDITDRHRAEEALARSHAEQQRIAQRKMELATLLDLALDSAELAYSDVNLASGSVNAANDRWYAILGYGRGELQEDFEGWSELVHPEDREARQLAWERHLGGEVPRYESEFRMRHKQGHWVWLLARGQVVERDAQGRALRVVGTRQDISDRKHAELWMQALAHTDELTGIHNRRRFAELAAAELTRAQRYGHGVALLMIDLDHFKDVNDRHGHDGGDHVLRSFVQTARTVMRQSDVFARVGGEEFAALLPYASADGARAIAERLLEQTLAAPCCLSDGTTVHYSISIGVAMARVDPPGEASSVQSLMKAADEALYAAKSQGRGRVVLGR